MLKFIQIENGNDEQYETIKSLWLPYCKEIDSHHGTVRTDDAILEDLQKRIKIQGKRTDMHFEIAYFDYEPIGFTMFAIDLGTLYGLLEKGCGYIMEFYIKSGFRRKGFGSELYVHVEQVLREDGAAKVYLTPDEITGEPFWKAIGFSNSGIIDPDNKMSVYIKNVIDAT